MFLADEHKTVILVPRADPVIRPAANRPNRLRRDEAHNPEKRGVNVIILGDELSDGVEGVTSADEEDSMWEGIRFDVVLPQICCEFFTFTTSEVCGSRGVFDSVRVGIIVGRKAGRTAEFGLYGWVRVVQGRGSRVGGGDGDEFGYVDVDDAMVLGCRPLDIRLCAVNLLHM